MKKKKKKKFKVRVFVSSAKKRVLISDFLPSSNKHMKKTTNDSVVALDKKGEEFMVLFTEEYQSLYAQYDWLQPLTKSCRELDKKYYVYSLPQDSLVVYCPTYLTREDSLYIDLFKELTSLKMEQPIIFNHPTPREVIWQTIDDQEGSYFYSRQEQKSNPMSPRVHEWYRCHVKSRFQFGSHQSV